MNIAKTNMLVVDDNTPINVNNVLIENVEGLIGTTLQPQGKEPGQRDTTKNHGRLGGIRLTPGYLQKQSCHLPEETGVRIGVRANIHLGGQTEFCPNGFSGGGG